MTLRLVCDQAEKRVNKAAALSVELVAVATGGARRPESKGSGHEPTSVVAIDCEMVGVGPSGKASSLARATVINNLVRGPGLVLAGCHRALHVGVRKVIFPGLSTDNPGTLSAMCYLVFLLHAEDPPPPGCLL